MGNGVGEGRMTGGYAVRTILTTIGTSLLGNAKRDSKIDLPDDH